jgi:hypothetical protein
VSTVEAVDAHRNCGGNLVGRLDPLNPDYIEGNYFEVQRSKALQPSSVTQFHTIQWPVFSSTDKLRKLKDAGPIQGCGV